MTLPIRASRVCARIAAGKSLHAICADSDMPSVETVHGWLADYPDFATAYARAQRLLAERLAEQVLEIADGLDENAGEDEARRGRLRIEARKWRVSQLAGTVVPVEETPAQEPIVFCSPSDFAGQSTLESAPESPESAR